MSAPHGARPRIISFKARDDMNMKLLDNIAERADVDFIWCE
jgi:hypothetical protein